MTAGDLEPPGERIALVVVGCHSCGIPMMTGALGLGGVGTAEDFLPACSGMESGNSVRSAVTRLNDNLLQAWGGRWDAPPPMPAERAPSAFVARAQALITAHYNLSTPVIVVGDPCISLLIPVWRDALSRLGRRVVFVLMVDAPNKVATSLHQNTGLDYSKSLALWQSYIWHAENDTREDSRVVVTLDELMADGRSAVARIGAAAGVALGSSREAQTAIEGFLMDCSRHRQHVVARAGPGEETAGAAAVYRAVAVGGDVNGSQLDTAWAELGSAVSHGADGWDVRCGYNLFLGREPEAPARIAAKVGLTADALARAFVLSPEWLVRVRDRLRTRAKPRGALFDRPLSPVLARWASQRLPLDRSGRVAAARARSWIALFNALFGDRKFQISLGQEFRDGVRDFLGCLDALARKPAPFLLGGRDSPRWTLVSGAARSGTSLLREMLHEHPHVALLQEYGLTALVERLEAVVARAPAGTEDWDSPGEAGDGEFNAVAGFYRDRSSYQAVVRGNGDLGLQHFPGLALGLFQTLTPGKHLRVVGDKMPMSSPEWEDVSYLADVLPGFTILVVLRNPAEVVKSSLIRREATHRGRDDWPVETVQEAVAAWVSAWHLTRELRRAHPEIVHVLKYEDLCTKPAEVMGAVYERLGLAAHEPITPLKPLPKGWMLHSPAEDAVLHRLMGPISAAWDYHDGAALLDRFPDVALPYVFGAVVDFRTTESDHYLRYGFSSREEWGRWIEGADGRIELLHGESCGAVVIEISVVCASGGEAGTCDLTVQVGHGPLHLFRVSNERRTLTIEATLEDSGSAGVLGITLTVAQRRARDSDQPRIGLQALRVARSQETDLPALATARSPLSEGQGANAASGSIGTSAS